MITLIEHKHRDINESKSKLSFTFTGGGNWEIWDRYLSFDGEQLFHIGNICGTCAFFFNQVNENIKTSYTIEEIRDVLNKGVASLDDNLTNILSKLMPVGTYEVSLFEIHPVQTCKNGKGDYFAEEQEPLWYPESNDEECLTTGMKYYRGVTEKINDYTSFYEFFVPLYQPEYLNEEHIQFYQEQIRNGYQPTAISLGTMEGKTAIQWSPDLDNDYDHLYFVHYLMDVHHKIQAAAREAKPITLISFVLKDKALENINKLVKIYDYTRDKR